MSVSAFSSSDRAALPVVRTGLSRLLAQHADASAVPCPSNRLPLPCARGASCPFQCVWLSKCHRARTATVGVPGNAAASRAIATVQVLLGEHGLAPNDFDAAFVRLCGQSLLQLTQLDLVALVAALPSLFVIQLVHAKAVVRNVRWPLPLDPAVPLPPHIYALPLPSTTTAATSTSTAASTTTTTNTTNTTASSSSSSSSSSSPLPTDASLLRLKREFEGALPSDMRGAELDRACVRIMKALIARYGDRPAPLTKVCSEFITVTNERLGDVIGTRPVVWLERHSDFFVAQVGPLTHCAALTGTPAAATLQRQRDEAAAAKKEAAANASTAAPATATTTTPTSSSAASTTPSKKSAAPAAGTTMSLDQVLDVVCDILGTKEMTFTAMAMQFMQRTRLTFSKAAGMMPGLFLRSAAVEATKRIEIWKKDGDWFCARRGNSVGPDTSIDNVKRKALSVLLRLLNADGGRSKLHHIANVFERETTHSLVSIFGAPLTSTLMENGRDKYFVFSGERVTLQPPYNEQHPRYDEAARAEVDLAAMSPVASPRSAARSKQQDAATKAAPAAPWAAASASPAAPAAASAAPTSTSDMTARTVMASPLPPAPANLVSDAQRSEAVSAILKGACEVAFGSVDAASARIDANVAVVTFVDDAACQRAVAAASVQVGALTVYLTRMGATPVKPVVAENPSLTIARQSLDATRIASMTPSHTLDSITSAADAIVQRIASTASPAAAPQLSDINARLAQLAAGAADAAAPATPAPAAAPAPATPTAPLDVNALNARLEGLFKSSAAAAAASPGRTFGQNAIKQMSPAELAALRAMRAMVPAASERQCKLHLREHEWDVVPSTLGLLNEMDDDMRTCCICKTNEIELQLVECRHACMCRSCFKELVAAARAKAKNPVECPLCREEIHNTIAIKMPRKATTNERKDVERIIKACADKPERLKPAQELAKGGYSLQICILALLRNEAKADKAELWLRDNCFAFVSADEAEVAASVAARVAAASVATPLGLEPTPAELMALQRRYDIKEHASWEAFSAHVGKQITKRSAVPSMRKDKPASAPAPAPVVVPAPAAVVPEALPAAVFMTDMPSMLASEGMASLVSLFTESEIDHEAFVLMTEDNLRELGVTDANMLARLLKLIELKRARK